MKTYNYYTVFGWMINELGLKGNNLLVYAAVYSYSQHEDRNFEGSLNYVAKSIGSSRNTAINSLQQLVELGYLLKVSGTKNNVAFCEYFHNPEVVQNLVRGGTDIGTRGSAEIAPNNNNNNKTDNNNILKRIIAFKLTLEPFLETYGKELINDFYLYWKEPNNSGTKFRRELERTWDLERRLSTWAKNDKNFNNNGKFSSNGKQQTASNGKANYQFTIAGIDDPENGNA